MIGKLDEIVRPFVLILSTMSGHVKIFKVKDEKKNNKLISFRINDERLLEKYKTIWTRIEDFLKY